MIDLAGFDKLEARFENLPKKVEKKVRQNLKKAAQVVEADAVLMAPVDTGHLRNNIKLHKVDEMEYKVAIKDKDVPYAKYVHYGTRYITPNPFLNRSLHKNRKLVKKIINEGVKESL